MKFVVGIDTSKSSWFAFKTSLEIISKIPDSYIYVVNVWIAKYPRSLETLCTTELVGTLPKKRWNWEAIFLPSGSSNTDIRKILYDKAYNCGALLCLGPPQRGKIMGDLSPREFAHTSHPHTFIINKSCDLAGLIHFAFFVDKVDCISEEIKEMMYKLSAISKNTKQSIVHVGEKPNQELNHEIDIIYIQDLHSTIQKNICDWCANNSVDFIFIKPRLGQARFSITEYIIENTASNIVILK